MIEARSEPIGTFFDSFESVPPNNCNIHWYIINFVAGSLAFLRANLLVKRITGALIAMFIFQLEAELINLLHSLLWGCRLCTYYWLIKCG